jgi:cellulose synthase/poly-beta-1,6-N-acetylglucosamine synthase-like glycosyltransferase
LFLKIILIALFILVSPIVLIPFLFSVINYLPDLFSYISFNLGREFFAEINLSNYLSLYLAIVSILVSVIIAVSLYRFEKYQERRERDQQQILLFELERFIYYNAPHS